MSHKQFIPCVTRYSNFRTLFPCFDLKLNYSSLLLRQTCFFVHFSQPTLEFSSLFLHSFILIFIILESEATTLWRMLRKLFNNYNKSTRTMKRNQLNCFLHGCRYLHCMYYVILALFLFKGCY